VPVPRCLSSRVSVNRGSPARSFVCPTLKSTGLGLLWQNYRFECVLWRVVPVGQQSPRAAALKNPILLLIFVHRVPFSVFSCGSGGQPGSQARRVNLCKSRFRPHHPCNCLSFKGPQRMLATILISLTESAIDIGQCGSSKAPLLSKALIPNPMGRLKIPYIPFLAGWSLAVSRIKSSPRGLAGRESGSSCKHLLTPRSACHPM
jgi:hypothetical protein